MMLVSTKYTRYFSVVSTKKLVLQKFQIPILIKKMDENFVITACDKSSIRETVKGINAYNLHKVPATAPTWTPLEYSIKSENDETIAGILGGIGYWGGLEIKVLWVNKNYRNRGLGTGLLKHVEKIAFQKGATISMLDTFDFLAEEFYIKNGYNVIGKIADFPVGHQRIYFSKKL